MMNMKLCRSFCEAGNFVTRGMRKRWSVWEWVTYAFCSILMLNWKLRDYMFAGSMEFSLHLHNAINSFGIIVVRCGEFLYVYRRVLWFWRAHESSNCTRHIYILYVYIDIFAIVQFPMSPYSILIVKAHTPCEKKNDRLTVTDSHWLLLTMFH